LREANGIVHAKAFASSAVLIEAASHTSSGALIKADRPLIKRSALRVKRSSLLSEVKNGEQTLAAAL
jgi:hypothetical protein